MDRPTSPLPPIGGPGGGFAIGPSDSAGPPPAPIWEPFGEFNPDALVAMLTTYYPVVSPAAFARARVERPAPFWGGIIIGSKGDKLRLPTGRIFDCIYAAGGLPSQQRWQAIDVTDAGPDPADPFPLEPGPVEFLYDADVLQARGLPDFESFVTGQLEPLNGADDVLSGAGASVLDFPGADAVDGAGRALLDPAIEAHVAIRAALDGDDPIDELGAASEHAGVPDTAGQQYVDEPPADVPTPDPGDPPDDKAGPGEPPPPAI